MVGQVQNGFNNMSRYEVKIVRKSSVCVFVALQSDMIYDVVEELAVGGCLYSVRASNIESGATEMQDNGVVKLFSRPSVSVR